MVGGNLEGLLISVKRQLHFAGSRYMGPTMIGAHTFTGIGTNRQGIVLGLGRDFAVLIE